MALTPVQKTGNGPTHSDLRSSLLNMIRNKELRRDQCLPSIRELSRRHRASKAAAERAVRSLVADGICRAEQGKGIFLNVDHPKDLDRLLAVPSTITVVFGYLDYPRSDSVFFRQVYEGIQSGITEDNCNILKLYNWKSKPATQKAGELSRFAGSVDGFVSLGIYSDEDMIRLRNTGRPVVAVDFDTHSLGIDCAVFDNGNALRELAREVLRSDPGEIYYLSQDRERTEDPSLLERRDAFAEVLGEAGRTFQHLNHTEFRSIRELGRVRKKNATGKCPFVVTDGDSLVPGTIRSLSRRGLSPGRDYQLAYVGPSEIPTPLIDYPALTVAFEFRKLGNAGAELFARRTKSGPGRPIRLAVPGTVRRHAPA